MIQIALTGNVASGKSTVAEVWAEAGLPVVSADELAREVVRPGQPANERLREAFGPGAFHEDGSLDRERMRRLIFRDRRARRRLEEILHPGIRALRDAWVEGQLRAGASAVVSEIPLLFEVGMEEEFDAVVLVHASRRAREARLVEGRGIPPGEARRMMAAGGEPDAKLDRADHVIWNDGSLEELRRAALRVLRHLRVPPRGEAAR